ncbi:unnamed protein product, partial [Mesorhabditis belari]|uniref:Uncharacterized protein n=1 Tax=Mesorhabditis belari TaxID=2138241 RepID=A0AAF3EG31_9BILA
MVSELLNGVCPQTCNGCPQYIAPPQSVVLTLPVPQNRLSGPVLTQASGPCCQPPQVQSVTWLNQPAWTNGAPGPIPTSFQNPMYNPNNAPYLQPSTVRPASPQNGNQAPPLTQGPQAATYNYNQANAGYSTPTINPSTQQPFPTINQGSIPVNGGYSTQNGNQGFSTPSPYNGLNAGYSTSGQAPFNGQTIPPSYNAVNDQYLQGQNSNGAVPTGYNGANQFNGQSVNPNDGEYTNTFEGTFVGPANPQLNGQGNFDETLGNGGLNGQGNAGNTNGNIGVFPTQNGQNGENGENFANFANQQISDSFQGQPNQNGNPNGNPSNGNPQFLQDPTQISQNQGQTQAPFIYSTIHPNDGNNPVEYPVTATANNQPFTQPPNQFQYSTQYNPNAQLNQQFPTTIGPNGMSVSQFDSQFQTTASTNYGPIAAAGAAGAAAGSLLYGSTTTQRPTNRPTTTQGRTTVTPFGQDGSGQFVQTSNTQNNRVTQTTTFPPATFRPTQTPFMDSNQFPGSTQGEFSDGSPLNAQHSDMNFQYSKGADGGSTLSPQMIGSSQPFSMDQAQSSTFSPFFSTGGTNTANRLYDHGDMNTQYGRYESTQNGGVLGGVGVGNGTTVVVSRSTDGGNGTSGVTSAETSTVTTVRDESWDHRFAVRDVYFVLSRTKPHWHPDPGNWHPGALNVYR